MGEAGAARGDGDGGERERGREGFGWVLWDAKETAEKNWGKRSKSKDTGEWGWGRVLSLLPNSSYSKEIFNCSRLFTRQKSLKL